MSFNTVVQALPTGFNDFDVSFTPYEPPEEGGTGVVSFRWTIHPKRRLHAYLDRRRKATPWRRLSLNTDFRPWRRVEVYTRGTPAVEDDEVILT